MRVRLTILCENSVGRPGLLIGEHGFACFVETREGNWLFDTGAGVGLVRNAAEMKKDLASVDGIILSHGHYDHTGGLADALGKTGPMAVFGHPDIFAQRFWKSEFEERSIGMPHSRSYLFSLGARFNLATEFRELAPGLWLSGEVPRRTEFEIPDSHLVVPAHQGFHLDPLRDDQTLILDSERGLVLLLGCAHAGLVNILHHALAQTGRDRIYAVLGGTHLGPAGDGQFAATLQVLKRFGVEKIGASHCTGLARAAQLHAEFGGRFFFAAVGASLLV